MRHPIGWLVSNGYVSPAFGRMLEVAWLTALAAGLTYAADALSGGKLIDVKQLLSFVLAAYLAYLSKAYRDASASVSISLPVTQPENAPQSPDSPA